MIPFAPQSYGPEAAALLEEDRLPALGPGTPNSAARPRLERFTIESLFAGHNIEDHDMARCCLSGLWLWHDFLDESHSFSQEISTPEGSYWHGIIHRREPDFSNGASFRRPTHAPSSRRQDARCHAEIRRRSRPTARSARP